MSACVQFDDADVEEGQKVRESEPSQARTDEGCITGICLSLKGHSKGNTVGDKHC